jgi:hypothetical protein
MHARYAYATYMLQRTCAVWQQFLGWCMLQLLEVLCNASRTERGVLFEHVGDWRFEDHMLNVCIPT